MGESADSFEDKFAELRRQAEAQLPSPAVPLERLSREQVEYLVHELQVHQIELEMQNEQLRQAQLELEVARDQYADLYDFAPMGYITLNEQGVILVANLTAANLLGVERARLIHQPLGRFIVKEDQDAVYLFQRRLFQTCEAQASEARLLRPDGSYFHARLVAIVQCAGESPVCRITISDITEHKLAEQYVLRTERVAAMGQLATLLADEIKNPLFALRLGMDLVLNDSADSAQRQAFLELCNQEIDRLIAATNNVLNFARPERMVQEPLMVNRLVVDTLTLVDKLVRQANIQVTTELPQGLPPIQAAPDEIVQILINLLLNAIEAMPNGGWIRIAAEAEQDAVRLTLAHQGPAISSENLKHVFEPSFTSTPLGAGLGLSVSRSIVRRLGGDLTVENLSDEEGIAYTLRLPIES